MKQVARVLSTYSADLFGVNSVLYELGGLVVMHDASGCNSTYNTHDEPRWYSIDSMIYISGLIENDVILGNDDKLIDDICEAAAETHPNFIAITAALIPLFMSTDMKGLARIIEGRTGIPTFGFTTTAMDSYIAGGNMAYEELLKAFAGRSDNSSTSNGPERPLRVNLLGVTPLDFSIVGNVEALVKYIEDAGMELNACMTMGYSKDSTGEPIQPEGPEGVAERTLVPQASIEEIQRAGDADVNLVCSSLAIDGARVLQEKFGTPYVTALPIGPSGMSSVEELLKRAASEGISLMADGREITSDTVGLIAKDYHSDNRTFRARQRAEGGTWIIGEVLWAESMRRCLEEDLGYNNVHIICPGERSMGILRQGDVMTQEEEDIEACLQTAEVVIADPIYRRVLPHGWKKRGIRFVDFPHEAYSGRMYRSMIPVFLGEGGAVGAGALVDHFTGADEIQARAAQKGRFIDWLSERLGIQQELPVNDIMKNNVQFAKRPKYPKEEVLAKRAKLDEE